MLPKYRLFLLFQNYLKIITDKLHIKELKESFEKFESFRTNDIAVFYSEFESNLKQSTLNWRIYDLVEKGVLERIGKGSFKLGKNNLFIPLLDKKNKILYNKIKSEFPYVGFCIWNTSLLNEFALHQSNKHFTLVEIEKGVAESIFYFLKEENNNVFLNPDSNILENFIFNISNPIIIKFLVSESPLQKINNCYTVTLEKILVDIFCDENVFSIYQGKEKHTIFKEAFEKYTLNKTKLLRYSSRRGKREEIESYITQIIGN